MPHALLAVGPEDAAGSVVIPGYVFLTAILALVGAFIVVGKMLLKEKDSKLALAQEAAKADKAGAEKRLEAINGHAQEMRRMADSMDRFVEEIDKRHAETTSLLNRIEGMIAGRVS